MSYPTTRNPATVASILATKIQAAQKDVLGLGKASLQSEEVRVAENIIDRYIVAGLELGKPTVKIDENKPHIASVAWPITGPSELIGLPDSNGHVMDATYSSRSVSKDLTYPGNIGASPQLQQEIKTRIESITKSYQAHFDLINAEVTSHNRHLRSVVPGWVAERLKTVRGTKGAEDFLNS